MQWGTYCNIGVAETVLQACIFNEPRLESFAEVRHTKIIAGSVVSLRILAPCTNFAMGPTQNHVHLGGGGCSGPSENIVLGPSQPLVPMQFVPLFHW